MNQAKERTEKEIDVKQALKVIIKSLKDQGALSLNDLQNIYHGKKEKHVPASVFATKLSPSEALCKYMKENLGMKLIEIAKALNRDQRSMWTNYHNALKKIPDKLQIREDEYLIPLDIFSDRKMSIFGHVIVYLVENYGLTPYQVAKLLNKKPGSVYTAFKKAKHKT